MGWFLGTLDRAYVGLTTRLDAILAAIGAVGGPAQNLLSWANNSAKAERGSRLNFQVTLYDRSTGLLIPSGDINITGISALILKSTAGGSFAGGGLTAIAFTKNVGGFTAEYLYVDGEWSDLGADAYKVQVSGVKATVNGVEVDVPTYSWSAAVGEEGDQATVLNKLDARPDLKTAATRGAADIGAAEVEITNSTQHSDVTRDALILVVVKAAAMDVAAANVTVRVEKDGVQVAKDTIAKKTGAAVFEAQLRFNLLVEASEVLRVFIESDNPGDTVATTSADFFEVG